MKRSKAPPSYAAFCNRLSSDNMGNLHIMGADNIRRHPLQQEKLVKLNSTSSQAEAAKALGISLSTYKRQRKKVESESLKINNPPSKKTEIKAINKSSIAYVTNAISQDEKEIDEQSLRTAFKL